MLVSLRSSPLSLYVCVKILSILNKKKKKKLTSQHLLDY